MVTMKVTGETLVALRSINKDDLRRTRTVLTVRNAVCVYSQSPASVPASVSEAAPVPD